MDGKAKFERKISLILMGIILVLVLFLAMIQFITDFMWFKEMGYTDVFFKQLVTQLTVGVPTFAVVTVLVQVYLTHLKKTYFAKIASSEETNLKGLKKTTIILSVVFGAIATFMAVSQLWFEILKFANSTDFDLADPLFNFDISFYIFRLEFLKEMNEILIGVIIGFVALTIIYYIILMTVRTPDVFKEEAPQAEAAAGAGDERHTAGTNPFGGGNNNGANGSEPFSKFAEAFGGKMFQQKQAKPKRQFDDNNFKQLLKIASGKISLLGFIFFIMLGINFFLRQFDLLHAHTGAVYGAGFTDVNVTLWMLRILCVLSVLAAILFVVQMRKKNYILSM